MSIPNCCLSIYKQDSNHHYQEMTAPLNHCNINHDNKLLPSAALLWNPGVAPNHVVNETTTMKSLQQRAEHITTAGEQSKPTSSHQESSSKIHLSPLQATAPKTLQMPTGERGTRALQTHHYRVCCPEHALLAGTDTLTGTRVFVPGRSQAGDPLTFPSLAHRCMYARAAG